MSHPVRVRGLKLVTHVDGVNPEKSHPVRVRGLKHSSTAKRLLNQVAPRAGAWIETRLLNPANIDAFVAPRAGAWIETLYTSKP